MTKSEAAGILKYFKNYYIMTGDERQALTIAIDSLETSCRFCKHRVGEYCKKPGNMMKQVEAPFGYFCGDYIKDRRVK